MCSLAPAVHAIESPGGTILATKTEMHSIVPNLITAPRFVPRTPCGWLNHHVRIAMAFDAGVVHLAVAGTTARTIAAIDATALQCSDPLAATRFSSVSGSEPSRVVHLAPAATTAALVASVN